MAGVSRIRMASRLFDGKSAVPNVGEPIGEANKRRRLAAAVDLRRYPHCSCRLVPGRGRPAVWDTKAAFERPPIVCESAAEDRNRSLEKRAQSVQYSGRAGVARDIA